MNGEGIINFDSKGEDEKKTGDDNLCEGHGADLGCKWYHEGMCALICVPCGRYEK